MTPHVSDTITYAVHTCKSVLDNIIIKCAGALAMVTGSFVINDVEIYALAAILGLTVIDSVTALMAAKKTGEPITSRKFGASIVKLVIYGALIAGGSMTEIVLGFNAGLNEAVMGFIAVREMISVVENAAKMGYVMPSKILNMLHKLNDVEIDSINSDNKEERYDTTK